MQDCRSTIVSDSARFSCLFLSVYSGEYLDYIVQQALGAGEAPAEGAAGQAQGLAQSVQRTINSLQYFMKSLTK